MKFSMKSTFAAASFMAFAMTASAPAANACGTVRIGDLDWGSAKLHTAITKIILESGYGCKTKVTTGSTNPIMAALYAQKLDVVMEVWTDNIKEQVDKAVKKGAIRIAGINTPQSGQGFYVDAATAKKYNLKTVQDMLKPGIAELFKDPSKPSKGRMTSCISGWSCYTVNLIKHHSYGLDKMYTNYDPGSSGALDAAIKGAFKKKKPIFTYYWEPTALMGQVDLVKLEEPAYNAKDWAVIATLVDDIKENGVEKLKKVKAVAYNGMPLEVGINSDMDKKEPAVVKFLSQYTIPLAKVNELLAHYKTVADGEADITAKHFLSTDKTWEKWVPADVAAKVKAAISSS
jgi:glycine betaine/proline transport system substrate-binding protein